MMRGRETNRCITRQCSGPAAGRYDVFASRSCGRPLIGLTLVALKMPTVRAQLPDSITQFHGRLNRDGVVPPTIYRRNHLGYPLLCYVNNIVGCLLCENYDVAALFVRRAAEALAQVRGREIKRPAAEMEYFDLVETYLRAVSAFVLTQPISPALAAEIPEDLRRSGGGN